jgi:UDP-2-acetamido-3-amino-2,3-dideoxy-glucuronate N-acetyltransferase
LGSSRGPQADRGSGDGYTGVVVSERTIACIGAGYWGKNLVRNFHELGVLGWIVDADPERRSAMAEQYPEVEVLDSVEAVLEDPAVTAVAIATPAATHGELVRNALEAGKDVLVEKPLCLSEAEADELAGLAEERDRVLMVGHLLWYHPGVLKLKELVTSGELGRIQYIYSNRLNLGKIRREENILWSFAPHDVSVILGLVEEIPNGVTARGGNYLHDQIADVTVSFLSFPSGVRAHIFVSWLHPFKEQKLVVVGDRRMAVFDDTLPPEEKLTVYPHAIEWRDGIPVAQKAEGEAVALEWEEPLRAECRHFLDAVANRSRPRTDGREGARVLRVLTDCEAALRSDAKPAPKGESSDRPDSQVHESAYIDDDVEIGAGTRIWHFSHVMPGSRIGEDCRIGQNVVIGPRATVGNNVKIQNNVSVYEGVTLEDDVFCGPSMVFTNVVNPRSAIPRMDELKPTLVRRGASLGANCTILCGTTVGAYAFVGAGATVIRDVPAHALVVGNPGRVVGWMCECGNRIDFEGENGEGACRACSRKYERKNETVRAL